MYMRVCKISRYHIGEFFIRIHITSKFRYRGVSMISTLNVSRTRHATPSPLPEWQG